LRAVTLVPSGRNAEGRLRFFIAVGDAEGRLAEVDEKPYPLSVPTDRLAALGDQEIGYAVTLLIRPGSSTVAVGIWDEVSGSESFVRQSVQVAGGSSDI
jgi:hypothetical protein